MRNRFNVNVDTRDMIEIRLRELNHYLSADNIEVRFIFANHRLFNPENYTVEIMARRGLIQVHIDIVLNLFMEMPTIELIHLIKNHVYADIRTSIRGMILGIINENIQTSLAQTVNMFGNTAQMMIQQLNGADRQITVDSHYVNWIEESELRQALPWRQPVLHNCPIHCPPATSFDLNGIEGFSGSRIFSASGMLFESAREQFIDDRISGLFDRQAFDQEFNELTGQRPRNELFQALNPPSIMAEEHIELWENNLISLNDLHERIGDTERWRNEFQGIWNNDPRNTAVVEDHDAPETSIVIRLVSIIETMSMRRSLMGLTREQMIDYLEDEHNLTIRDYTPDELSDAMRIFSLRNGWDPENAQSASRHEDIKHDLAQLYINGEIYFQMGFNDVWQAYRQTQFTFSVWGLEDLRRAWISLKDWRLRLIDMLPEHLNPEHRLDVISSIYRAERSRVINLNTVLRRVQQAGVLATITEFGWALEEDPRHYVEIIGDGLREEFDRSLRSLVLTFAITCEERNFIFRDVRQFKLAFAVLYCHNLPADIQTDVFRCIARD